MSYPPKKPTCFNVINICNNTDEKKKDYPFKMRYMYKVYTFYDRVWLKSEIGRQN